MRKLTLSLMVAGLISPLMTQAVGLGELIIDSGLNQPLKAEIGLVSTTPAELNDLKVRLAPSEVFAQIGIDRPVLLNRLIFTPTVENGRTVIKVNSLEPVTEPFLNFVVEVDWSQGRLLREYTVLLDPPSYTPSQAPVVSTPVNTIQEAEIVTTYEEPVINSGDEYTNIPLAETFPVDAGSTSYETVTGTTDSDGITYYSLDDGPADTMPVAETYPVDGTVTTVGTVTPNAIESLPDAQTFPLDGVINEQPTAATEVVGSDYFTLDDSIGGEIITGEVITEAESAAYGAEYSSEYGAEYLVQKGDTLWNIATTLNDGSHSTQQMMIALLRANPKAFVDENINQLKSGYILRMPEETGVAMPGRSEALAEVSDHNSLWKAYRNAMASGAVQQQSGGSQNAGVSTTQANSTRSSGGQKQVEIIVPKTGQGTKGTVLADAGRLNQLQNEAALAQEQINSSNRKNQELQSRVNELQNLVDKKNELIEVNNASLQALQEKLKSSNGGVLPATAPSVDTSAQQQQIADMQEQLNRQQRMIQSKDQQLSSLQNELRQERDKATEPPETSVIEEPIIDDSPVVTTPIVTDAEAGLIDKIKNSGGLKLALASFFGLIAIGLGVFVNNKKKVKRAVEELHQFDDSDFPDELEANPVDFGETGMLEITEDISSEFSQEVAEDADIEVTEQDVISDAEQVFSNLEDTSQLATDLEFDSEIKPEDTNVIHAEFGDDEIGEGDVTGEFPILDIEDEGNEEDELLAEVDIYLAYGLHDQVIEELKPRLEEEPGREDYLIRLFKAYYEKKDKAAFAREAEVLKSTINTSSQLWKDIAVLGYSLDAVNPLYAGGDGSAISASDLIPDKPAMLDINTTASTNASDGFHETEVIEPYAVSPEELGILEDGYSSIEDELVETVILEETGLHELRASENAALAKTAADRADAETKEFSSNAAVLDLDVDSAADVEEIATVAHDERKLSEETTEFEFDLASMKGLDETSTGSDDDATAFISENDLKSEESSGLDFDLEDIGSIDGADSLDLSQTIRISDEDKEALNLSDALDDLEGELPVVTGDDEMNTKLDLAKAYVDMGDDEGARDALNEVIASGSEQQKVEAERLLNQLT